MILEEGAYYKFDYIGNTFIVKIKKFKESGSLSNRVYNDLNFYICNNIYYYTNINYIPYKASIIYEKIDIKEILHLLPDDNLDKINYIRKQRIKSLLT